jgi:hypothetical protein
MLLCMGHLLMPMLPFADCASSNRNSRTEPCTLVHRFLSFRHYGGFFVFNLCDTYNSSDGVMGNYNHDMLFNQVLSPQPSTLFP